MRRRCSRLAALALAYVVIVVGYVRVARARGLGARVLPYAITGVALVVTTALTRRHSLAAGGAPCR